MSVQRAQKSEVHETTDDADSSPAQPGKAEADRDKLFPEARSSGPDNTSEETRVRNDPVESSFGGPLRIDEPSAGAQP